MSGWVSVSCVVQHSLFLNKCTHESVEQVHTHTLTRHILLTRSTLDDNTQSWVTGTGKNKVGETFECTSFRHSTSSLLVELRLDSAHGALFRSASGEVLRVDRHDGSVMKRAVSHVRSNCIYEYYKYIHTTKHM